MEREYRSGGASERARGYGDLPSRPAADVPRKSPQEEAAERLASFAFEAQQVSAKAAKLTQVLVREQWRADKAALDRRRIDLEASLPDREKDAALAPAARKDFDTAKVTLQDVARVLDAATEPRPKPPVTGELDIEPRIRDKSALPDDVLAWAAGLDAGQRNALGDRLRQATTTANREDGFAVALANYLAATRLLQPFRNVLANPKKHFDRARYERAAARDATVADASSATADRISDTDEVRGGTVAQTAAENSHAEQHTREVVTTAHRNMDSAVRSDSDAGNLDGNFQIASGGDSARIRRSWLREKPLDHWYEVLGAMQAAGAVPWAQPEALQRFARRLAEKHAMKDEVVTLRLDPIAIAIIGLPPAAAPKVERIGDDLMIAVPGVGSTGSGETISLDETHNPERFGIVYLALEAFTGLPVANRVALAAVGASTTTAVMRLHDRDLAQIFGPAAWEEWKAPKLTPRKTPKKQPTARHEDTRDTGPDSAPHADAANDVNSEREGDNTALDADERARITAWFSARATGVPRVLTRSLYSLIVEIEKDPALASALKKYLQRGQGQEHELDETSLRAAVERARLEIERARLGLGTFRRDRALEAFFGPLQETNPFDSANVPARLVQKGLLLSGRPAHFEVALDWGAYRGSSDQEFAGRDWRAVVEWVFERVDAQGPSAPGGQPVSTPQRFQTEHMGNAIGLDHTFQLGPHEQSGTWMVHAFLHTSHFAPKHVSTTVEVKTEAARMEDLRREAFAGVQPANAKSTAHRFDIGTGNSLLKPIDLDGHDPDTDGTVTRGDLPADFQARTADKRASGRQLEIQRTKQLVEYLRSLGEARYADALASAQRRLERLQQADQSLAQDAKNGWQSFELRGTYLSRHPEVPSGPLDLYGSVKRERFTLLGVEMERVSVQIRDLSQRLGPDLPMFTGEGASFESAFEQAFVDLSKEYPDGKVAVMAEMMDTQGTAPTSTRKAIGFELATTSPWKRVKDKVYNPVVQTVVNVAATALMVFQPQLAPILLPILTVSNTVRNVDELVHRYENNTLKSGFVGVTLAQIGLDFMPFMRGAKVLQSPARLVAFEAASQAGMVVVMGLQTRDAIAHIQEADIAALAEQYRELLELQKTTNPSDPELARRQREIQEGADRIRERVKEEWTKAIGENGIFMVGSHVLAGTQRRIVAGDDQPWSPGHKEATGAEYEHLPEDSPYRVPHRGRDDGDATASDRGGADKDISKESLVENLATGKALAEQHAHADGSVPVESVLSERPDLTLEARAHQLEDLKKIIDEVAEEAAKAKASGKAAVPPTIGDLRPDKRTERDATVSPADRVIMVSLEDALNQEKGLVNRLHEAKLALQQAKSAMDADPRRVALLTRNVIAILREYRQHLVMRKPDYAHYAADVQTGLEFFRRYKMITGHNLTPREIADTRASAGQLASQELRVGIGGDAMKDVAALKALAKEFNQANDEARWFGDKSDVSLIVNTTKKKSGSPEHAEDMARLIDEWGKDSELQRAVSGLDNAGVESAKLPPSKLWKMSAKRAFMNANAIKQELAASLPSTERDAFLESYARVLGTDKTGARSALTAFESTNFDASMMAVDSMHAGADIAVSDTGQVMQTFAGITMEDAARTTRELVNALRAHRAETGDARQLPRLLGYTVHAGEQLKDMDPFELLKQVDEAIGLGADRIGHGLILAIEPKQLQAMGRLSGDRVDEFLARQAQVREHAKAAGVTIEMNITSNTEISNLSGPEHPAANMVKSGLKVSVSTDDETTLGTTVKDELIRLAAAPSTTRQEVAIVILEGFYSRMGARELPDRGRLKREYRDSLLQGLSPREATSLAQALAERFHTRVVEHDARATVERALDAVFGTGS